MTEEPGMVAILLQQKERVWKCAFYQVNQVLLLREICISQINNILDVRTYRICTYVTMGNVFPFENA